MTQTIIPSLLAFILILTACAPPPVAAEMVPPTATPTLAPTATATSSPTPPPPPTLPPPTATVQTQFYSGLEGDPFATINIDALTARSYGGPGIVLEEPLRRDPNGYTQYAMHYYSDGIRVNGLINIPPGFGPFPVALCLHGYAMQHVYYAGYDSARMCDWIAEYNYIGIMPDYRNYGESERGPNPFRIGYAIDILNLVAQLDSLPSAAPEQIGIIGHSLGGEIALWAMVISPEVDAIVLYGSMSGDVARNWQHRWQYWPVQREAMVATAAIYGKPEDNPAGYASLSPINYLDRVRMPVHIHHGRLDSNVPFWWSEELATLLTEAGKDVTLFEYGGEGHGFTYPAFDSMMQETLALFDEHARGNTNTP